MFTRFLPRSADRRALLSRSAPGTPVLDSSPLFALDAGWCEELEDVLFGDPIPNLYSIEHYLAYPLPVKAPRIPLHYHQGFVGAQREGRLCCLVLLGSNVVPSLLCAEHRDEFACLLLRIGARVDSIFGESDFVMPLWEGMLEQSDQTRNTSPMSPAPLLQIIQPSLRDAYDPRPRVLSVRPVQPLLHLPPQKDLSAVYDAPLPPLPEHLPAPVLPSAEGSECAGYARLATAEDEDRLLPAAAAMFTEEVGFNPVARYGEVYRARLRALIAGGRSAVVTDTRGRIIFKADAGIVNLDVAQVQGVWLHPDYRGRGLAKPFFASAARVLQRRYRHLSLYVNDYNTRAVATYTGTGWEPIGQFSTIIFGDVLS